MDGAHISTLLLTLFYRFMPELIYEGHVYIAMPPLYKAMPARGKEEYLYDDKALERYRKTHKGAFTLQRYKGLGEMDAQQLWETTLNPETRLLKLVEIEDARMASDITEILMGTEVPPRKAFIYEACTRCRTRCIGGKKMANADNIIRTEYSEIMQKSYIDYAMSVIVSRALPDVRDGLKPVQRRTLYDMYELGIRYDRPYRKCARIVGDTMGKYHPHGDSSIYDALVVMAQEFKKGQALVDGHGNFGSIEGDGAAAMRYTEARLEKITQEVYLNDLDKDVVDFVPNFDETEKEPEVLPVRVPNLLLNGADGIAVGMATSIPPHNLNEVVDGVIAYMKNNEITNEELMQYIQGPDFPTGGIVVNKDELLSIYEKGTGKIKLRGKVEIEKGKAGRNLLVITEIPYTMIGANIGKFLNDVAGLVESKKTTDIVDISNQSSKEGIRIVLELKKGTDIENLTNMLYKKTRLEDTFGVNMLAVANGKPETLSLKQIIEHHVDFQFEVTTRKYNTLLSKEKEKQEIQEGLIKACDVIDLIIEILRGSKNREQVKKLSGKRSNRRNPFPHENQ